MWNIRTSAPSSGTNPYNWSDPNKYQCTWYSYYRVMEGSGRSEPPCWFDKASGTPGYTNAKLWLDESRSPWQVKSTSYIPQAGDIAVFTGNYGHCMVIESKIDNDHFYISDYNMVQPETFFYGQWTRGSRRSGYISSGDLIGYLHNPNIAPGPGPTPEEYELEITIHPSYYSVSMGPDEDYVDFPFSIDIWNLPGGDTASGGNTYPGLSRVYNTGWQYMDYWGTDGNQYRRAQKNQTLRYEREHDTSYITTKHMYYELNKSTGYVYKDIIIDINVQAKRHIIEGGRPLFLNPYDGSIDIR